LPTFRRPLRALPDQGLAKVICVGVKHLKVIGPVVVRRIVLVMNHFCRQEVAAENLLRHQTMFSDIAVLASARVIWAIHKNVALLILIPTTLPARVF
jgi:hypothetical protein